MTPTLSREIRELADAALRLQAATGANVVTNILHAAARRIDAEEDVIDGWSGNLRRDGMPSGGRSEDTVVERAMMARYELRTDREDLRDCLTSATAEIDALLRMATRLAAVRHQAPVCTGTVTDGCTNIASEHRDATGTAVVGLCDACWAASCPTCHKRPAETRRRGLCEPCRHKQLRAGATDTEGVMA